MSIVKDVVMVIKTKDGRLIGPFYASNENVEAYRDKKEPGAIIRIFKEPTK
ncbi:MAG: hypothetical protein WC608_03025 [Parcubacteria group bacterium]